MDKAFWMFSRKSIKKEDPENIKVFRENSWLR